MNGPSLRGLGTIKIKPFIQFKLNIEVCTGRSIHLEMMTLGQDGFFDGEMRVLR